MGDDVTNGNSVAPVLHHVPGAEPSNTGSNDYRRSDGVFRVASACCYVGLDDICEEFCAGSGGDRGSAEKAVVPYIVCPIS